MSGYNSWFSSRVENMAKFQWARDQRSWEETGEEIGRCSGRIRILNTVHSDGRFFRREVTYVIWEKRSSFLRDRKRQLLLFYSIKYQLVFHVIRWLLGGLQDHPYVQRFARKNSEIQHGVIITSTQHTDTAGSVKEKNTGVVWWNTHSSSYALSFL